MTTYRNMIVTAADAPLARAIAEGLDPASCTGMFTTGLCPTDAPQDITHYISSGFVSDGFAALIPLSAWAQDPDGLWVRTSYTPGHPGVVAARCQALDPPLDVTDAEAAAMFADSDISEQDPFVAMGRLGLVLWQHPVDAQPQAKV